MIKFVAATVTMAILTVSSTVILADNSKSKNTSTETSGQIQSSAQTSEESTGSDEKTFEENQQKIAERKALIAAKKDGFKTKKSEFAAFKDILSTKRIELIALQKAGNMLHAENAKLQSDLRTSLASIKEKGLVLPAETLHELDRCIAQIKDLTAKLKETKGQIHSILKENKKFIKEKDYVSMEIAFDEIFVIQHHRNDCLTQINTLVKDMIIRLVAVV